MGARSVFFDFGGTLCRSRADLLPIFREAARRAGVEVPWEEYLRANEECWNLLWPQAAQLVGAVPAFADRVHEMALRRIGFDRPTEVLVRNIREEATSARWHEPFPETEPTLKRLRAAGVPLHIISGHVDYLPIIIANLGWSDLFDTVTFTQEVGVQKPDPRVFRFALRRAGHEPGDSLYVGDSWEADYLGALNAGMAAVWLNRPGMPAPAPCREIRTLAELDRFVTDTDP
jgi:putative hydrolase of the HAD superfamily